MTTLPVSVDQPRSVAPVGRTDPGSGRSRAVERTERPEHLDRLDRGQRRRPERAFARLLDAATESRAARRADRKAPQPADGPTDPAVVPTTPVGPQPDPVPVGAASGVPSLRLGGIGGPALSGVQPGAEPAAAGTAGSVVAVGGAAAAAVPAAPVAGAPTPAVPAGAAPTAGVPTTATTPGTTPGTIGAPRAAAAGAPASGLAQGAGRRAQLHGAELSAGAPVLSAAADRGAAPVAVPAADAQTGTAPAAATAAADAALPVDVAPGAGPDLDAADTSTEPAADPVGDPAAPAADAAPGGAAGGQPDLSSGQGQPGAAQQVAAQVPVAAPPAAPALPDGVPAVGSSAAAASLRPSDVPWQPTSTTPTPLAPAVTSLAHAAARNGGAARIVLRLDPPELGSVVVTLTLRGGDVHVGLQAADSGAASQLDARRADVRDALADAGLDLEGWSVDSGDQGRQQRPDERRAPAAHRSAPGAYAAGEQDAPSPARVTSGVFL